MFFDFRTQVQECLPARIAYKPRFAAGSILRKSMAAVCSLVVVLLGAGVAEGSGPRWVAGVNYFDPAAKGKPIVWANGNLTFYIDQGGLSPLLAQSQVVAMLSTAAAVWTSVPTAAVSIVNGGVLAEDVNGANVVANSPAGSGAVLPVDVQPSATSKPVAVIMDVDGTVINAIYGPGASDPANCTQDGIFTEVDNITAAGHIAHGLMILNGLCATTQAGITLMQYQMVRAFGRLLGLDWSQANELTFPAHSTVEERTGWPMMHPIEWFCTEMQYACMINPTTLRLDDIAGLNRLYPVTSANIGAFANKQITASATISVQGTISFKRGQGMQGVNVVLTPLTGGVPNVLYPVSAVSGVSFHSNAGNPIEGTVDAKGNTLNRFGTDDATMEGYFDLSGVPLPPGATVADYQLSFEAIKPLFTGDESVGPYTSSQVTPSGTMPVITLPQLSAGNSVTENVIIEDSADETHTDDGTEAAPNAVTANGEWLGRITGYGHTGWYLLEARANRVLTVEAVSLDENGSATLSKAGVQIGFWNGSDPLGSQPAVAMTFPFNGAVAGLSTLNAQTSADGQVRIAFADMRGDGRPDYVYRARVLYAESVFPARLAPAGGPIVIQGIGFRANSVVTVNGVNAAVTSVTATEITAVAPAAAGAIGLVAVTVTDPQTQGTTSILDGLSYDAHGSDQIGLVSGPSGTVNEDVPMPLMVRVVGADNVTPAANVLVNFSVPQGSASLGCGAPTCNVTTNGAGMATLMVAAKSTLTTQVVAALTNGATVIAEFNGSASPSVAAVTPNLYVAIGSQVTWQPAAIVLNGGTPMAGASVSWSTASAAVSLQSATSATNQAGQATITITAGPLAALETATVNACKAPSTTVCTQFAIAAVDSGTALLTGVTGVGQELAASGTPVPVVLEVTDAVGHPLAGATVNFYEALHAWQPSCPASGQCPATQTLATKTVTTVSDANGLVSLTPLTGGGQATSLLVNATTGLTSSLAFSIVQHP